MDTELVEGDSPEISNGSLNDDELTNDIVTVSKLQIALRAGAKTLQTRLSEIALHADTASPEGLFELLQQAATTLLDHSHYWTHVLASSQTIYGIEEAESLFLQWSDQERSKFNVETLTNVDGVIHQKDLIPPPPTDRAAYIVVTLLLGTADDQPLFKQIYSASMLRDVLEDIRMMRVRYLMVLEVLWSPQNINDSLTETELMTEYTELVAIA